MLRQKTAGVEVMSMYKITLPDYYVDIRDNRYLGKRHNCARSFNTIEDLAEYVKYNCDNILQVHYLSDNGFTLSLGTSVKVFEEYLKTINGGRD